MRSLGLAAALTALAARMLSAAETRELHFKSPAAGMRFTAGLPVQVWADVVPRDDDHPGWPQAECYWDERMVGSRVCGNNKAYNYIHHEYRGTWSQGFNFYCENSEGVLAEHNVLRAGSWPLQSFGGEFRYNLMIDSGHNWVRTLTSGTRFHHNLLVHTGDAYGTGMNGGLWLYNNRQDVAIYNNTFDGGAPAARDFQTPIIALSTGCTLSSLRNNIFTGVQAISPLANNAIVARGGREKDSDSRVAYADYNCFFTPEAPAAATYDPGIVGKNDAGAHDVHADPKFAEGRLIPYSVNEADVWNRKYTVSQLLALYRQRYAPAAGSPLVGAGDPADGPGSYIGAIGPGSGEPHDQFGRFLSAD